LAFDDGGGRDGRGGFAEEVHEVGKCFGRSDAGFELFFGRRPEAFGAKVSSPL
jgi:hypothetical protein